MIPSDTPPGGGSWKWPWLDALVHDLRYSLRQLRRSPGFALVAVATIGLGIGINTAAFTVYDSVALKPLPVRAPNEMVRVVATANRGAADELPYSDYDLIKRSSRALTSVIAASTPQTFAGVLPNSTAENPRSLTGRFVSDDYFTALGISASRGRVLHAGDAGVIVVSHDFWTRQLHADPDALGKSIAIQGNPLTIMGIAPSGFAGTGLPPAAPDFWEIGRASCR